MKPILFNTEDVRAILDDRKTVTRRCPFNFEMKDGYNPSWSGYSLGEYSTGNIESGVCLYSRGLHDVWGVRSNVVKPKYNVGDILYVRETWLKEDDAIYFKADSTGHSKESMKDYGYKWKPSIHMPKEVARIFLRVTDVRVERLQDINQKHHDDVLKEGIRASESDLEFGYTPAHKFRDLWQSIYGNWDDNPWVWVYEFERCEQGG